MGTFLTCLSHRMIDFAEWREVTIVGELPPGDPCVKRFRSAKVDPALEEDRLLILGRHRVEETHPDCATMTLIVRTKLCVRSLHNLMRSLAANGAEVQLIGVVSPCRSNGYLYLMIEVKLAHGGKPASFVVEELCFFADAMRIVGIYPGGSIDNSASRLELRPWGDFLSTAASAIYTEVSLMQLCNTSLMKF